ncbi:Hsp33 family molecular chaperone HslO [Paenibacillus turpanensis]|uniref:Hsp33 family molecular chaperone HslO n=1 Tax=Paenibacillus turpanensis TaxID=2689078 RepID=UPI00140B610E|nr:Hsp33 family molecular chaperone HslO [Paenibacillus turpanensis]
MQDYLVRGLAFNGKVRVFGAMTKGIVEELRRRHDLFPVVAAALGRTATGALMMGAMLKGEEHLSVRFEGGGPVGKVVAEANAKGEVRGFVANPHVELPLNAKGKLDVAGAVGTDGYMTVIKDLGLREPYHGSSPIVSGEIAEDFTYYFAKSEQTPSAVALGVLVDTDYSIRTAGGFIIQLLPGLSDEDVESIEAELQQLPPITTLLDQGLEIEQVLERILKDLEIMERMDLRFACRCSREKVERSLISLGKGELNTIADEDKGAELNCHYCNEIYPFTEEELRGLADQIG